MSYDLLPITQPEPYEFWRKLSRVVNGIMQGKTNNTGTVTLATGATITVVELAEGRLGENTVIHLDPLTQNAAYESFTPIYVSVRDVRNKTFTISHSVDSSTDRTFRYSLIG